jgi:hypothetical protein
LVANEWTLVRTFGKPNVGDNAAYGPLVGSTALQPGDTLDLGPHMTVEGTYTGDFIDGTKPFSKWEATANNSVSIGYPPQLLDIAGKPLIDLVSTGIVNLDDSFALDEPRTFYTVYRTLDYTAPTIGIGTYGMTGLADSPSNSTMMLRLQMSGTVIGALNRRTGGGGPVQYNVPPLSTNVSAWGMNASGIQFVRNNNASLALSTQVMSVPHQQINIYADTAYHKHVRTIVYRGFHDAVTQAAVSRYLGNKYGANVA